MNAPETDLWAFGGPLAGVAPATAWTILAAAAGLCVVLGWVSYRHSVRRLGAAPCALLTLLRTGLLLTLLYCVANPLRVDRVTARPPEPPAAPTPPRLAVVVDRSDSMTLPDNRGRTRLDDALASWRKVETTAQTFFGPAQYFSFAEDLRPAATLAEALKRTGGTGETRLYQSVSALLKKPAGERPDTVVVLTDGLDTSNESEAVLRDSAIAAGVPIYFVAGTNRSGRPDPFVRVREWRVPPTALRSSEFTIEATFEAFSRADRTVPFSLWQAGRRLLQDELKLTTGANLVTRSYSVGVGEPGPVEFSLRIGPGDEAPVAARAVAQVLDPRSGKVRVLVHQSALDWGLRYFSAALRTDPSFEFFTIVTPEIGLTLARATQPSSPMLGKLPDTAAPYAQFDCVVLVHPYPKRLAAAQQQALVDFVRGGGTVLFMSPDAEAMPQFAGGPLDTLLPVYFDGETLAAPVASAPVPTPSRAEVISRMLRPQDRPPERNEPVPKLSPFVLTEAGRASPIFARTGGGLLQPRFMEYVPLSRAKPGAEVLAVHPTARSRESSQPHVLLATQAFGQGRSALLTTDALWRWKLDEPSESRAVETFWQQLLLAISRKRREELGTLRFANAPVQVRLGQTVTLRFGGFATDKLPFVATKGPDGRNGTLAVKRIANSDDAWSADWTPGQAGGWEITADVEGAHRASIFPSATTEVVGELARTVPPLEALNSLAGETGGALLAGTAPEAWRTETKKEKPPETVTNERQHPKWNRWNVLLLALGLYAAELGLRRRWKLL